MSAAVNLSQPIVRVTDGLVDQLGLHVDGDADQHRLGLLEADGLAEDEVATIQRLIGQTERIVDV